MNSCRETIRSKIALKSSLRRSIPSITVQRHAVLVNRGSAKLFNLNNFAIFIKGGSMIEMRRADHCWSASYEYRTA